MKARPFAEPRGVPLEPQNQLEQTISLRIYRDPDVRTHENTIPPDDGREEDVPPPQGVPAVAWVVSVAFWIAVALIVICLI